MGAESCEMTNYKDDDACLSHIHLELGRVGLGASSEHRNTIFDRLVPLT